MESDGPARSPEQVLGGSAVRFSSSEILPIAESSGFKADLVEKVLHLIHIALDFKRYSFIFRAPKTRKEII